MSSSELQIMLASSHISGGSAAYVDALYEDYLKDPHSVPSEWQRYFAQLPASNGEQQDISHADIREYFLQQAQQKVKTIVEAAPGTVHLLHEKK